MKILFVKPSNLSIMNPGITQPLGVMYLSSYLKKIRANRDEIRILDMRCYSNSANDILKDTLSLFKPDIIGISSLTIESREMGIIAKLTKQLLQGSIVIAGGPHVTAYPEDTLMDKNIDFGVLGEGEEVFAELIECLDKSRDPASINSIVFRKHDEVVFTPKRINYIELDSLPFPDWGIIDREQYYKIKSMSTLGPRRYMSLFTSRGCPYRCIYCHNIFGKEYRARSIENIIMEIKILKERHNINEFEITDDCFNFDIKRTKDFFTRLINDNLNVSLSFPNGLRVDLLDEKAIELMKRSGVNWVAFAIETASARLQKLIKKNLDLPKAKHMINYAIKKGIYVNGFFMLGFPTETESEIKETIEFAIRSQLCQALFFLTVPFNNTGLSEFIHVSDLKSIKTRLDLSSEDYFICKVNLSLVSNKKLLWLQRYAYIRFYFSFRRLIYFLRYYPTRDIRTILFYGKRIFVQIFSEMFIK